MRMEKKSHFILLPPCLSFLKALEGRKTIKSHQATVLLTYLVNIKHYASNFIWYIKCFTLQDRVYSTSKRQTGQLMDMIDV